MFSETELNHGGGSTGWATLPPVSLGGSLGHSGSGSRRGVNPAVGEGEKKDQRRKHRPTGPEGWRATPFPMPLSLGAVPTMLVTCPLCTGLGSQPLEGGTGEREGFTQKSRAGPEAPLLRDHQLGVATASPLRVSEPANQTEIGSLVRRPWASGSPLLDAMGPNAPGPPLQQVWKMLPLLSVGSVAGSAQPWGHSRPCAPPPIPHPPVHRGEASRGTINRPLSVLSELFEGLFL